MRKFTDKEVFEKLRTLKGFEKRSKELPLLVGVQSLEDKFDAFDDKFFLYDENNRFMIGISGTTNAGSTGLKDFLRWNPKGTGIWATNYFYPKCFGHGFTKGQECLRLITQIYHYRDNNKNDKVEEKGQLYKSNTLAHFHGIDFDNSLNLSKKVATRIGGYSVMCQVANVQKDYAKVVNFVKPYEYCDYAILKEW